MRLMKPTSSAARQLGPLFGMACRADSTQPPLEGTGARPVAAVGFICSFHLRRPEFRGIGTPMFGPPWGTQKIDSAAESSAEPKNRRPHKRTRAAAALRVGGECPRHRPP